MKKIHEWPSEKIHLQPKIGLTEEDIRKEAVQRPDSTWVLIRERYNSDALSMVEIEQATVMGHTGFVYSEGQPYPPSLTQVFGKDHETRLINNRTTLRAEHAGPHAIIFNYFHRNYWHWHLQCLPNIILLEEAGLIGKVRIVVPKLASWQRESLNAMGIADSALLEIDDYAHKFEKLVYCPLSQGHTDDIPMIATRVFKRVREGLKVKLRKDRKKIYLTRMDSNVRRIVNESEVAMGLLSMGYQPFTPGTTSYFDQVDTLSNASIVVAPHGAGVTNVGFAEDGALFEVFPNTYFRAAYAVQASLLDQPYTMRAYPVIANGSEMVAHAPRAMEWQIPVPDLMARVRRFERQVEDLRAR